VVNVLLWWIGASAADTEAIELVRRQAERVYAVPVRIWHGRERPADAFDARRQQHSSTRILQWLNREKPAQTRKVLAITDADLFIPILTFVFGEAQLDGPAAVVSIARLSANGGPPTAADRLLRTRLVKECVHELGHTFGLIHCSRPTCVMARSVNLIHVDAKDDLLCHDCWTLYRETQRQGSE
jgi:archaemetzincin